MKVSVKTPKEIKELAQTITSESPVWRATAEEFTTATKEFTKVLPVIAGILAVGLIVYGITRR